MQPVSLGNRVLVLARAKPACARAGCNPREEPYGHCVAVGFGKVTVSRRWYLHHLDLAVKPAKPVVSPSFWCAWAAQPHLCIGGPRRREPRARHGTALGC